MPYTYTERILVTYRQSTERIERMSKRTSGPRRLDILFTLADMSLEELLELRGMVDTSIAAAEMRERAEELGLEDKAQADTSGSGSGRGKGSG